MVTPITLSNEEIQNVNQFAVSEVESLDIADLPCLNTSGVLSTAYLFMRSILMITLYFSCLKKLLINSIVSMAANNFKNVLRF